MSLYFCHVPPKFGRTEIVAYCNIQEDEMSIPPCNHRTHAEPRTLEGLKEDLHKLGNKPITRAKDTSRNVAYSAILPIPIHQVSHKFT